ncbi:MAG: ImmA/IrrE family metallo-endopeptidase [Pedobacter sp.]
MSKVNLVFEGMKGRDIDRLAEAVIQKFQPEVLTGKCPFDIEQFAEFDLEDGYGFTYHVSDELPHGIFGVTDCTERKVWIHEDLTAPENIRLLRSTAAHETGHCIIHAPQIDRAGALQVFRQKKESGSPKLYRKDDVPIYRNPEWQAHRFAGALLMPASIVNQLVRNGAGLYDLVEKFDVHPAFVRSRLRALKILIKN